MTHQCPEEDLLFNFLKNQFEDQKERIFWRQHLTLCKECRDLQDMENALRQTFMQLDTPRLSTDFSQDVVSRIDRQRHLRHSGRTRRILLQGYWIGTATLSYLILNEVWNTLLLPLYWLPLVALLGLTLIILLDIVLKPLNLSFSDLVLETALDPEF